MKLKNIVRAAIKQRPEFKVTIGFSEKKLQHNIDTLPKSIVGLYNNVKGTLHGIENQALMDIIPGYRLIHVDELSSEIVKFRKTYPDLNTKIPFLADYASCYYTVDSINGAVYLIDREYNIKHISLTLEQFLKTILAFYEQGVYFLDDDGYLDYDFDES